MNNLSFHAFCRNIVLVALGLLVSVCLNAQTVNDVNLLVNAVEDDTASLLRAFRKGKLEGHIRYFFMATQNDGALSDYYANAIGGGVKYETAPYKGFTLGIGGFIVFNLGSSDLAAPDKTTGQFNRYELGLFDITDPANKHPVDRLEELYVSYSTKKTKVVIGAQLINTPFINGQDGRMRPTEVAGIYNYFDDKKKTKVEGGIIFAVSPRSTANWYSVANSIGIYAQGINKEGNKNNYAGNTNSKAIMLAQLTHEIVSGLQLKLSNLYVENVFNTIMVQADFEKAISGKEKWFGGAQMLHQNRTGNGGNEDPLKAYYWPGNRAWTFGWQTGIKTGVWSTSVHMNRITARGQYLMPREWGRDPFYTFLPRERNEGVGNVTAWVLRTNRSFSKIRTSADFAIGSVAMPDPENYKLNKYGMPSYYHVNMDIRHQLGGLLKGADIHLLYARKFPRQPHQNMPDRYRINRIDMNNWNLIINFRF